MSATVNNRRVSCVAFEIKSYRGVYNLKDKSCHSFHTVNERYLKYLILPFNCNTYIKYAYVCVHSYADISTVL